MASVFQVRNRRLQRWRLTSAIITSLAGIGCLASFIGDRPRPGLALILGVSAVTNWIQWKRLPKHATARIEVDDSGIHFFPAAYWQLDRIAWRELMDFKTDANAIWLRYNKDGKEMIRDIPLNHLGFAPYNKLFAEIQRMMSLREST